MLDVAIFISKRLQRAAAAFLCLMTIQLVSLLAESHAEPAATAPTRVAIAR